MNTDYTKMGTSPFDGDIWSELAQVISDNQLTSQDVLENFMLFYRRVNFAKFVTHIELFKHTVDLPGSIVELGVFKGASFMTFLKLCDVYCAGDTLKKVIGFDTWTGFVDLDVKDGAENIKRDKVVGGFNASTFLPVLRQAIEIEQRDSMIPRFSRAELVQGDCRHTIPQYLEKNPGLRISMLHLDLDLYEPTKVALEHLYDRVVPGGVVILDEYGMEGFPGESLAFDEFFAGRRPVLKKFPFISTPGGYFIKGE
ncbi:TylF/MycF/NovP-related O-methyltransferase [Rheinheimera texasensis]|uniref:TylF/MycF/NovP-related O-methyltransferase n=1 Tax=Rheinheimera texasensis TaxID=306205 RepID=UPI0004E19286|nr:TylF/MycF/NovP-related O-methyltransferase [Rheinheimera texasensis]